MNSPHHIRLQGWTLSETLVMMIIAGIVFTAIMDGFLLFSRYMNRKTEEIISNMRIYEGYYLLGQLTVSADSVSTKTLEREYISLFRKNKLIADLFIVDSALMIQRASHIDTLLSGVSEFMFAETHEQTGTDSIRLTLREKNDIHLNLSFPVKPVAGHLVIKNLSEYEKQYLYE